MIKVIKKTGLKEEFDINKVINAMKKSARRVCMNFSDKDINKLKNEIMKLVEENVDENEEILVQTMHFIAETALKRLGFTEVWESYSSFRNWKTEQAEIFKEVMDKEKVIRFRGDKSNANTDDTLVSTKRCLVLNEYNKEVHRKFDVPKYILEALTDGFIYEHDQSARRDTFNCSVNNVKNIMRGGFEMGNIHYNEPKTLDVSFDVLGDIILSNAAQQYGGYTVPQVDKMLGYYAEKSYNLHKEEYIRLADELFEKFSILDLIKKTRSYKKILDGLADNYAWKKTKRECEQGYQGIEIKLNTVASSRGDYPFTTFTFGIGTGKFERLISETILDVHQKGQGEKGKERPVLFPKLVFLYDENLHGDGKEHEDLYIKAIECSSKTMYPDYLSLTGEGYVPEMYKKYGIPISPMGCRSFVSPWYERGGMYPEDEDDDVVLEGRNNVGVVSLNLPMIYMKSKTDGKNFYEVLDYYLEMIRTIHCYTYDYLGEMSASCNPLSFCEGGLWGGNLKPSDKIEPVLRQATASFGVTALNELEILATGKSIYEGGEFSLEVMRYIQSYIDKIKIEDNHLYAVYGTPAESLCGTQREQFVKKFGYYKGVTDTKYFSNSFHCHVSEKITQIQKQDKEKRFWDLFNGGKIQYCRYPSGHNIQAIKSIVDRAMKMGFYEGVNISLVYCAECGKQIISVPGKKVTECNYCGSRHLTEVDRVCGYIGYKLIDGDTRLNEAKIDEVEDRISM